MRRRVMRAELSVRTRQVCLLENTRFEKGDTVLGSDWPGGFLCPCHGSRFDLAGRVFNGSPASADAWVFRSNSANIVCRTIVARIESISRAMMAARSLGDVARSSSSRVSNCSLKVLATSATKIVYPASW